MDIQERIVETEQKFEQKKSEREQHLQTAEELLVELTKLQGEWRLLKELSETKVTEPQEAELVEETK